MKIYYGWYVVAVAMLFQAVTFGLGSYAFTFWVEHWMREFGAGRGDVMWATTVFTIALGVMGPAAGWAFDRVSMRVLICLGGVAYAAGLALISVSTALWQIVAIYAVLLGLGFTLAGSLGGQALAAKWFRGKRGLAIGIVLGASGGLLVWWRWGESEVALVVGLALFAACSTATLAAMAVPWLLDKFDFDPAFGSGPLATVIQDLSSILIYFAIATAVIA